MIIVKEQKSKLQEEKYCCTMRRIGGHLIADIDVKSIYKELMQRCYCVKYGFIKLTIEDVMRELSSAIGTASTEKDWLCKMFRNYDNGDYHKIDSNRCVKIHV
jgi:hypothetical protein